MKTYFSLVCLVFFAIENGYFSSVAFADQDLSLLSTHSELHEGDRMIDDVLRDVGRGGSVAIVASEEGIVAVSADEKYRRILVPKPVSWVLVDNRSQVLWFGIPSQKGWPFEHLMFLDLTRKADSATAIMLVKNIGLEKVMIEYKHPQENLYQFSSKKTLKLSISSGKISLRNRHRLTKHALSVVKMLAKRVSGKTLELPRQKSAPLPPLKLDCGFCKFCGKALLVPGTEYWAVSVNTEVDFQHVTYQLYDPKTKEFLDPEYHERSTKPFRDGHVFFGEAWICSGGDIYVYDGKIVRFKGGVLKTRGVGGDTGGCLGGGWYFKEMEIVGACPEQGNCNGFNN